MAPKKAKKHSKKSSSSQSAPNPPQAPASAESTSQPKSRSTLSDPPPQAFLDEMQNFYAAKDAFDEIKMSAFDSLPAEPPNRLPKVEDPGVPWFDREIEDQMSDFLPKDANGEPIFDVEKAMAALNVHKEDASEGKQDGDDSGKEKGENNEKELRKRGLLLDEDRFVKMLTKGEGLIVPPGLYRPREETQRT